jgi:hypothetical protein
MADAQQIRAQRGKLTLGALGNPSLIKSMTPDQLAKLPRGKLFLGTIYGRASGFIERSSLKDEEKFEGLKGSFIGVPNDAANYEETESGVLYIPDAFHNLVAEKLREVQKTDAGASVEFAFEVNVIPAKNPAGYSWELTPAVPFEGKHPLADLMAKAAKLTADKQKQLAAPPPKK